MRPLALITGSSSGIGTTFATELAALGYDLVLVARRRDRLEELAGTLERSRGIKIEILPADLTVDEELAVVEQRVVTAENLELLVNNAGFGTRGKFFQVDLQSQDQMHRLHVLATMRLTHAALTGMTARDKGGIINVSSVAGFWQSPGSVSYCATKCWMNSFTEGLALELKSVGSRVRVQALCPGYTLSEFHDVAGVDPHSTVETFVAVRLMSDSWRWADVPILIRAGKCMAVTATEVTVKFRHPPRDIFGLAPLPHRNELRFRVWPETAVTLTLAGKKPGVGWEPQTEDLTFAQRPGSDQRPYDRLIGAALDGERWVFARQDTVEAAWTIVDAVLGDAVPVHPYARGSWGPKEADRLLPDRDTWHDPAG